MQIKAVLDGLAQRADAPGQPTLVRDGYLLVVAEGGKLVRRTHEAAVPYTWPIGHDVRPATQALGAGGCTDCHAPDAPITFGLLRDDLAAMVHAPRLQYMYELQGEGPEMMQVWATSFALRGLFKTLGFAGAIVLGCVLVLYGSQGLRALLRGIR